VHVAEAAERIGERAVRFNLLVVRGDTLPVIVQPTLASVVTQLILQGASERG
jgi:hypothetical protein